MRGQRLLATAFFIGIACLPEIEDDLPDEPVGSGGGSDTGFCEGPCCPEDPVCYPDGDKLAPGGECLATRDNRGKDRVQIRTTWTRTLLPEASTGDITYQFLRDKGQLGLSMCNVRGVSGYILLFDWDRSDPDITKHTVRSGYSIAFEDGLEAINDGLCFVEAMYSDPDNGWVDPVHIKPTVANRVAEDFDIDAPGFLEEHRMLDHGIFYFNEETGEQHGYAPKAFLIIHEDNNENVFVPIAHDVETRGRFNDPAVMNCQGRWRTDVLTPDNDCAENGQTDPGWGCDDCDVGMGPTENLAHFLIEELEMTYVNLLRSTLCVQYMGQQKAIDEGWADPDDWGLNCSGSPRWQAGERPRGDWCHETNSPATADCADSYRSGSTGVASAVNIREETCVLDGLR